MAYISFDIDFGDPEGDVEDMGCEDYTSAQEVIDALKRDGRGSVQRALSDWCLLDMGTVRVTFYPDVPESIQPNPQISTPESRAWTAANKTTAEWSDFGG